MHFAALSLPLIREGQPARGFKDLIERARKIKTVKHALYWDDGEWYSNRQGSRMKMGGFMGEITYEGELGEFWPYIKLGEYVHVGKGSGFGGYRDGLRYVVWIQCLLK